MEETIIETPSMEEVEQTEEIQSEVIETSEESTEETPELVHHIIGQDEIEETTTE